MLGSLLLTLMVLSRSALHGFDPLPHLPCSGPRSLQSIYADLAATSECQCKRLSVHWCIKRVVMSFPVLGVMETGNLCLLVAS